MILVGSHPKALLLDTCAIIYILNAEPIRTEALEDIDGAGMDGGVFVSPISAWEIGLLSQRSGLDGPSFAPDARTWFKRVSEAPTIVLAPFNIDIAIASTLLAAPMHKDPADRFLVTTARYLGVPIVTRDRLILDHAAAGHVDAIAC